MVAIVLYLSVTIPGIRTIIEPLPTETEADHIETLRIIGASNTMSVVCLVAVLAMQVLLSYTIWRSAADPFCRQAKNMLVGLMKRIIFPFPQTRMPQRRRIFRRTYQMPKYLFQADCPPTWYLRSASRVTYILSCIIPNHFLKACCYVEIL